MGAAATTTGTRNIYEPANADVYLYKADDAAHMSERAAAQLELAIARGDDGAVKDALANLARAATAAASTEGPAHRDGSSDSFKSPIKASLAEKKKHYSAHKVPACDPTNPRTHESTIPRSDHEHDTPHGANVHTSHARLPRLPPTPCRGSSSSGKRRSSKMSWTAI